MYVYHSACVYKVLPIQVPELAIDSLFFLPVLVEASGRQLGNGARETRDSLKDGELGSMEG